MIEFSVREGSACCGDKQIVSWLSQHTADCTGMTGPVDLTLFLNIDVGSSVSS